MKVHPVQMMDRGPLFRSQGRIKNVNFTVGVSQEALHPSPHPLCLPLLLVGLPHLTGLTLKDPKRDFV
jgi:hypothetical protein